MSMPSSFGQALLTYCVFNSVDPLDFVDNPIEFIVVEFNWQFKVYYVPGEESERDSRFKLYLKDVLVNELPLATIE